jgi:hypothetical protein
MVEPKQELHEAAKSALREAEEHLGADARRFRAAVDRCVNAVEVADVARRLWVSEGRPMWSEGSKRQLVEHPLVRTMDRLDAAASRFGGLLGLDPVSAQRLGRVGARGRPVGASAPDRRLPPMVKLKAVPEPPTPSGRGAS